MIEQIPETVGEFWNRINGTYQTQQFTAEEAQKARDFEKQMAETQYQRAVADIEKAGLNPAMLYQSGGQGNNVPTSPSGNSNAKGDLLGSASQFVNAISNARMADYKTKTNEISAKTASTAYQAAVTAARAIAPGANEKFMKNLFDSQTYL